MDFFVPKIVAFQHGNLGSSRLHKIYFAVPTAGGAPIGGIVLREVNSLPAVQDLSGDRCPGKGEFTMWAADYRFRVVGNSGGGSLSSEVTHILTIPYSHAVRDDLSRGGICPDVATCEAMGPLHFGCNVTLQRTQ